MKDTVFAIATIRPWNIQIAEQFIRDHPEWKIHLITEKGGLKKSFLEEIQPLYFFPHWFYLVPKDSCGVIDIEFSKAELLKNNVVQALVRIHLEAESDD